MAKSWTEKYNTRKEVEHVVLEKPFADIKEGEDMVILTPAIIEKYIRELPPGHSSDIPAMRVKMAKKYNADKVCPVTSGIFTRIVAEREYERLQNGADISSIAPFWRFIGPKSPMLKKLSFGSEFILKKRKEENLD